MTLTNANIGTKMMLSATAMLLAVLAIAAIGWRSSARLSAELEQSTGPIARQLELAGNLKAGGNGMRTGQRGILLNALQHDQAGIEATRKDYESRRRNVEALLGELKPMMTRGRGYELIENLEAGVNQHAAYFQRIYELSIAGSVEEAAAIYRENGAPSGAAMEKAASALMSFATEEMKCRATTGRETAASARTMSILSVMAGVFILVLVYKSQRGITAALRRIAGQMESGSNQVVRTARQLTEASQSLAQASSEQAAALEQTSASAEQIHSMAVKNTRNSQMAASVATSARQKFDRSERTLEEMAGAMRGIGESSDKISRIIKVIDEIAFQTNILALNAAVEAARAGDAGMGFGVVADEVRSLAQRSAQAAKDTADLIAESIQRSKEGRSRMDDMATAIRDINQEEMRVKVLVDEVSAGSGEQTRGVEQISQVAVQMQQATQSIAAAAEETAAAVQELYSQGEALHHTSERLALMVAQPTKPEYTGGKFLPSSPSILAARSKKPIHS